MIQAGQAHDSLASIASLPVALQQLGFKQALPVVGTVADVTDAHVFKRWGEVWRFKSLMIGANFTACALNLAPGNSLTRFGL